MQSNLSSADERLIFGSGFLYNRTQVQVLLRSREETNTVVRRMATTTSVGARRNNGPTQTEEAERPSFPSCKPLCWVRSNEGMGLRATATAGSSGVMRLPEEPPPPLSHFTTTKMVVRYGFGFIYISSCSKLLVLLINSIIVRTKVRLQINETKISLEAT